MQGACVPVDGGMLKRVGRLQMIDKVEAMLRDILTKHLKVRYSKHLSTCNPY